jgi:hypothetical protein
MTERLVVTPNMTIVLFAALEIPFAIGVIRMATT